MAKYKVEVENAGIAYSGEYHGRALEEFWACEKGIGVMRAQYDLYGDLTGRAVTLTENGVAIENGFFGTTSAH